MLFSDAQSACDRDRSSNDLLSDWADMDVLMYSHHPFSASAEQSQARVANTVIGRINMLHDRTHFGFAQVPCCPSPKGPVMQHVRQTFHCGQRR
jgi:hypothetical protein